MKNLRKAFAKKEEGKKNDRTGQITRAKDSYQKSVKKLIRTSTLEPAVRKIVRRSARIADLITDKDIKESMEVIRDAKQANLTFYDKDQKKVCRYPDNKTRLAAVALERSYDEGLPQRNVNLTVNEGISAREALERIKSSPELSAALRALAGAGVSLQDDQGEVIDAEFSPVQESPSENEGVA